MDTLSIGDPRGLYAGMDIYRSGTNLILDFFGAGKVIIENQYGTASRIEYLSGDYGWGPFSFQTGLIGTAGADFIVGTSVAETISGGLGGDLIWGGAGSDILSGGTGYDEVYCEDQPAGIFVNLSGQTQAFESRLIGANKVFETASKAIDTLTSIEDVNGTNHADYFMLGRNNSNTSISLGKGNDTVDGGGPSGTNYWTALGYYDDPAGVIVNLSRSTLTVTLGATTYNVGRGTAKDGWGNTDSFILYDENLSIIGSEYGDYFRGRHDTDSDGIHEWFGGGRGNDTIDGGTGTTDTAGYGVDDDEAPYGAIVNLSSAAITVGGLTVNAAPPGTTGGTSTPSGTSRTSAAADSPITSSDPAETTAT